MTSSPSATSLPTAAAARLVFSDVRVFDGNALLAGRRDVVVVGNEIAAVMDAGAHPVEPDDQVFQGRGRTLMPGLIDAHWHSAFAAISPQAALAADAGYVHLLAGQQAERTLRRGFTTVRDAGGPAFALQRAIDDGVLVGPRIYPSGAFISQTSGHGDFRTRHDIPRDPCAHLTHVETSGTTTIADGVEQVLRAVREQLMLGATQIKVMAGGGVASPYDPIDVTQYTMAEMRAAVEAADNWGTYVTVHAYTPQAIAQSVHAGVRCIEHGHLADDDTAALLAETGTWWCIQPFLDDDDAVPLADPASRAKQLAITAGTDRAYGLARTHGVSIAFGSDILFDERLTARQGAILAKLERWFDPVDVLAMATSGNADLVAMCGLRNPYPGRLGVVEVGALADLLLVDGDPTSDLGLLADPDRNLAVIVKDGAVHVDRDA